MKLINEKGKLFGIINVIDLCVILLIVLVAGVLGIKYFSKDVGPVATEKIFFTVRCTSRADIIKTAFKKGDQLISVLNPVDAYVESTEIKPTEVQVPTDDGKLLYANDPKRSDILVKIRMNTSDKTGIIKLGTQDVAVGKAFTVKTHTAEFQGAVVSVESK